MGKERTLEREDGWDGAVLWFDLEGMTDEAAATEGEEDGGG